MRRISGSTGCIGRRQTKGALNVDQVIEYKLLLKDTLSKKRCQHSLNVASECERLAAKFGEDERRAYIAGLLHDVKKDASPQEQLALVRKAEGVDPVELECPALWHAIAGAVFARQELRIEDEDMLGAIRYHTVAKAGMTMLQKIVYLGDLVSVDRTYKDVGRMRKLTYANLDKAMLEALRFSISDLVAKGNRIPVCTIHAYNDFLRIRSAQSVTEGPGFNTENN